MVGRCDVIPQVGDQAVLQGLERSQRSPVSLARIWRDLPCFTRLGKPKRVSKRRARASRENGDSNGNRHSTNTPRNWRSIRRGAVMTRRVADLLVETLQASGVKTCYGIVGDTMNRIAHAIDRSQIDWVHVRHEEAGAFAAAAEASLTGRLTACAGTCGPGSLHFINGLYEANRNRAPVILIATQIVRRDLGFQSIQEIDFNDVFKGCSVYCEMIVTALRLQRQKRRPPHAACGPSRSRCGRWRVRYGSMCRRRFRNTSSRRQLVVFQPPPGAK